jgi:predicted nucleic acid-binding protein
VIVVSDSSPLISLAKIGSFDLLHRLFGEITISSDVYTEVVVVGSRLPGAIETTNSPWIQVRHIKHPKTLASAQERLGLGLGELSTVILAKEIGADLVILDELRARKLAQHEGFRVQGTIGILEACFRKGHLLDLRTAYTQLLKCGIFLNRDLLNRSLESFNLAQI